MAPTVEILVPAGIVHGFSHVDRHAGNVLKRSKAHSDPFRQNHVLQGHGNPFAPEERKSFRHFLEHNGLQIVQPRKLTVAHGFQGGHFQLGASIKYAVRAQTNGITVIVIHRVGGHTEEVMINVQGIAAPVLTIVIEGGVLQHPISDVGQTVGQADLREHVASVEGTLLQVGQAVRQVDGGQCGAREGPHTNRLQMGGEIHLGQSRAIKGGIPDEEQAFGERNAFQVCPITESKAADARHALGNDQVSDTRHVVDLVALPVDRQRQDDRVGMAHIRDHGIGDTIVDVAESVNVHKAEALVGRIGIGLIPILIHQDTGIVSHLSMCIVSEIQEKVALILHQVQAITAPEGIFVNTRHRCAQNQLGQAAATECTAADMRNTVTYMSIDKALTAAECTILDPLHTVGDHDESQALTLRKCTAGNNTGAFGQNHARQILAAIKALNGGDTLGDLHKSLDGIRHKQDGHGLLIIQHAVAGCIRRIVRINFNGGQGITPSQAGGADVGNTGGNMNPCDPLAGGKLNGRDPIRDSDLSREERRLDQDTLILQVVQDPVCHQVPTVPFCHGDASQLVATGHDIIRDARYRGRKADLNEVHAVIKDRAIQSLQPLGQNNRRKALTVCKGGFANGLEGGGQGRKAKRITIPECESSNGLHRIGHLNVLQARASVERKLTDLKKAIRQDHLLQRGAFVEGFLGQMGHGTPRFKADGTDGGIALQRDEGYRGGDHQLGHAVGNHENTGLFVIVQNAVHLGKIRILGMNGHRLQIASLECRCGNIRDALADHGKLQSVTACKGSVTYPCHVVGDHRVSQAASLECLGTDHGNRIGDTKLLQGGTTKEGRIGDGCHIRRKRHGTKALASAEHRDVHASHTVGDHDLLKGGTPAERHIPQAGQVRGQMDLGKALTASKGIGFYVGQVIGQDRPLQSRTAREAIPPHTRNTVGDDDLGQGGASREGHHTDRRDAVGDGDGNQRIHVLERIISDRRNAVRNRDVGGHGKHAENFGLPVVVQDAVLHEQMAVLRVNGDLETVDAHENTTRKLLHALTQTNRLQGTASREGLISQALEAVGQIYLRKCYTLGKGIRLNGHQITGQYHGLQGRTAVECGGFNGFYRFGYHHGLQGAASGKCGVSHLCQSLGEYGMGERSALREHLRNIREGVWNDDLANPLERADGVALSLNAIRQGEPFLVALVRDQDVASVLYEEAQAVGGLQIGVLPVLAQVVTVSIPVHQGLGIGHDVAVIRSDP